MQSRRPSLTRERVVEAALELLDEVGLEALSVRALARKLGVQVGALYWHVAGKQDLLAAMTDRMMRELRPAGELEEWGDLVTESAYRLRGVLLSHRDGAQVFVSTLGLTPNVAESAEAVLKSLREAGFPLEAAAHAMNAVATFVIGFVLMEQSSQIETEDFQAVPDWMVTATDPDRFPNLAEWMSMPHRSRDDVFAAQIRLIINGLRAEHKEPLTD
jgi:TetR/AcrR family tetracycline transcriptional repressor